MNVITTLVAMTVVYKYPATVACCYHVLCIEIIHHDCQGHLTSGTIFFNSGEDDAVTLTPTVLTQNALQHLLYLLGECWNGKLHGCS